MTARPDAPLPWKDKPRNQCGKCGKDFANLEGFDFHRVGDWNNRHCLTKRELTAKGYTVDERGLWFNIARRERTRGQFGRGPAESSEPLTEPPKSPSTLDDLLPLP